MTDALIKLGGINIYGFGLLAVFSFLWGGFVFYKKAVESHFDDYSILDGIVFSAIWAVVFGRLGFVVKNISEFWNHMGRIFFLGSYPGMDKWGVILGIVLGIFLIVKKFKARFFDWFDFVSLGITSGMAVFYAGMAMLSGYWQLVVISVLLLVAFIILWRMEDNYRTFSWYRGKKTSARSGFIGGTLISIWGFSAIIENILFRSVSLVAILWGIFLFVGGLVLVYIRSGRTVSEDIKIIFKNGKN